jgi:hypothetical protein
MNEAQAKNAIDTLNIDYVIIGYKYNGVKCIPVQYEMHTVYANKGNVYEKLVGFIYYRIFDVSESKHSKETWDDHYNEYIKTTKDNEERELYQQLKKKFE